MRALGGRLRERFPGLTDLRPLASSVKCDLHAATLDGRPVVLKALRRDTPVWRWYTAREAALLGAFDNTPPPVEAPSLVDYDEASGAMVLSYIAGTAPSRGRSVRDPLPDPALRALLDACTSLARWERGVALSPSAAPPPELLSSMRERLLEDPTSPATWCAETLTVAARHGALPHDLAERAARSLPPRTAFAHGDLLPRNVIVTGEGVAFVDWECSGPYALGWDLAQLWTTLPAAHRPDIEATAGGLGLSPRCFAAVCMVSLARERHYHQRHARGGDPRSAALDEALMTLAERV